MCVYVSVFCMYLDSNVFHFANSVTMVRVLVCWMGTFAHAQQHHKTFRIVWASKWNPIRINYMQSEMYCTLAWVLFDSLLFSFRPFFFFLSLSTLNFSFSLSLCFYLWYSLNISIYSLFHCYVHWTLYKLYTVWVSVCGFSVSCFS